MAIALIQPVSDFAGLAALGSVPQRTRSIAVEPAPLVATPSVFIALGQNDAIPPLYNSVGLLQSLNQLDADVIPSAPATGSEEGRLQDGLATVPTIRALDSLLASDLRLAATALNTSLSTAAALAREDLSAEAGNDIGIFNDLLGASVEIPGVSLASLPAGQTSANVGTSTEDLAAPSSSTNGLGSDLANLRQILGNDASLIVEQGASPTAVAATGAPANAAAFQLPNAAADPNAVAFNSVARDPAYAAAAVAFYLGSAGFGPRTMADNPLAAVAEPPDAALAAIPAIRAVKPV